MKELGADETFDYKKTVEEQIEQIGKITGGKFKRVFDASAMAAATGMGVLEKYGGEGEKWFATTNDWFVLSPLFSSLVPFLTLLSFFCFDNFAK